MLPYDEMKALLPGIDEKIAACPRCKKCNGFAMWKSDGPTPKRRHQQSASVKNKIYYNYCGGTKCHHQANGRYAIYLNDPYWAEYLRDGGSVEEIVHMKRAISAKHAFIKELPPDVVEFFKHRSDNLLGHKRGVHGGKEVHSRT